MTIIRVPLNPRRRRRRHKPRLYWKFTTICHTKKDVMRFAKLDRAIERERKP